jgi:hypothetical protein
VVQLSGEVDLSQDVIEIDATVTLPAGAAASVAEGGTARLVETTAGVFSDGFE